VSGELMIYLMKGIYPEQQSFAIEQAVSRKLLALAICY
jgi:hypothetical protein